MVSLRARQIGAGYRAEGGMRNMAACRECNRRFVRDRRFGVGGSWDEGRGGLALLRRLAPRHAKQGFSVVALLSPTGITRSEERRGGKVCVRPCRSRRSRSQ